MDALGRVVAAAIRFRERADFPQRGLQPDPINR